MAKKNLTILFAPLDWGLGHVTRCIPLVQYFIANDFNVLMAVNQSQKKIIQNENIDVEFVELNGYNIKYSRNSFLTYVRILLQIPKLFKAIKNENKWLNNFCLNRKVDMIISDNRYGFYHQKIFSVFITHQLQIQTGNQLGNWILQKMNYKLIQNFNECWIPDFRNSKKNIAGKLSHPKIFPKIPIQFLGLLTRFNRENNQANDGSILIILSGPEPQRTILEKKVLADIITIKTNTILVRGVLQENEIEGSNELVTIINFCETHQLERLVLKAEYIICRSGYSSLMDYLFLKKKMLLIPTSGQTEQKYLAQFLLKKKWAICKKQKHFNLEESIKEMKHFTFDIPDFENDNFKKVLDNSATNLKKITNY